MDNTSNSIADKFFQKTTFDEKEALTKITQQCDFISQQVIGKSSWWGSKKIGAIRYQGIYQGKPAILKIQGVKPEISEIYMIKSFAQNNQSQIIRPPQLYFTIPWTEKNKFEALIMEYVRGPKIITSGQLQTEKTVKEFYQVFKEYRNHCRQHPWIAKRQQILHPKENFQKWQAASKKIYPLHPYREKNDSKLINKATQAIWRFWKRERLEFQHGHFSGEDLIKNKKGEIVLFSNLYWSWRPPFYDAVFAYHWFMYSLAEIPYITPQIIEEQRNLWLKEIFSLKEAQSQRGKILLKVVLLERASAGLIIDSLTINPQLTCAAYLVKSTRNQVVFLTKEIEKFANNNESLLFPKYS